MNGEVLHASGFFDCGLEICWQKFTVQIRSCPKFMVYLPQFLRGSFKKVKEKQFASNLPLKTNKFYKFYKFYIFYKFDILPANYFI